MSDTPNPPDPSGQRTQARAETNQLGEVSLDAGALVVEVVPKSADVPGDFQHRDRPSAVRGDVVVSFAGPGLGARADELKAMFTTFVRKPTGVEVGVGQQVAVAADAFDHAAAICFSQTLSVVTANPSGIGFPETIAWSFHPTAVRLAPRHQVASRSVVWLGNSSGLPSVTLTRDGFGLPFIRCPARRRNCSKSGRRARRLMVDWSGSRSGRADAFQLAASHAQLIGRSWRQAQW